jgi:DNA (cytosine-5)-methyltransferase 1
MRPDFRLCGCQFKLPGLRRERWFETSWRGFEMRPPCSHHGVTVTVSGHGSQGREYRAGIRHTQADRRAAMGIDWMNREELREAIPPAFTEYIGAHLLNHIKAAA